MAVSKTLFYDFWHDYIKPRYQQNAKLCYMRTDSFIIHIKTEDFYKDFPDDAEKRFDTSNDKVNMLFQAGKKQK